MRIFDVKKVSALWITVCLFGCGSRPKKVLAPARVDIPHQSSASGVSNAPTAKAVWFATTNYANGGTLARLELASGALNTQVLDVGSDVQIFQDGPDALFLLTRMHHDSIAAVSGASATLSAQYFLKEAINPQGVARDSLGRVWLTAMDSNTVQVLSSDLKSQVGSVDLSVLKEEGSTDGFAELAQVASIDVDHMAVSAQRLHRGVSAWRPDAKSGLAMINVHSLGVENLTTLDAPNPSVLFPGLTSTGDPQIVVIGSGDLSSPQGVSSALSRYSTQRQAPVNTESFAYRILSASVSVVDEPPAVIAWYQSENRSCVQIGSMQIVCAGSPADSGYVFNKILRYGNLLFVSYIGSENAQLWIVPVDGSTIQKFNMNLPIESMSFGP